MAVATVNPARLATKKDQSLEITSSNRPYAPFPVEDNIICHRLTGMGITPMKSSWQSYKPTEHHPISQTNLF